MFRRSQCMVQSAETQYHKPIRRRLRAIRFGEPTDRQRRAGALLWMNVKYVMCLLTGRRVFFVREYLIPVPGCVYDR